MPYVESRKQVLLNSPVVEVSDAKELSVLEATETCPHANSGAGGEMKSVDAVVVETPEVDTNIHSVSGVHTSVAEAKVEQVSSSSILDSKVAPVVDTSTEMNNLSDEAPGRNIDASVFTPGEKYHATAAQQQRSSEVTCTTCNATLTAPMGEDAFFQAEALGTVVEPQCSGCRCSKCPVPGSKFSFSEQREFDAIMNNLFYDEESRRWKTKYPWKFDRSILPRNDNAAMKQLLATEKFLKKNPDLAVEFCDQIQSMLDRGVAVILSEEEIEQWEGDYHYLAMVGVKGKKSYRVCFDFARKQGGAPSFNDCLMKGPDRYLNNLLKVIIGFRNGRVGCAADITKFHNQVQLVEEDVQMQRFFWRNLNTDEPPKTYAVTVNNFGAKPANCIATCALRNSADKFADVYPEESKEIKEQTYIDDELTAAEGVAQAEEKTRRWDEIKAHASMPNKGWLFSFQNAPGVDIGGNSEAEKVLGLIWDPKSDTLRFRVQLKVKLRTGDTDVVDINTVEQLLEYRESILTRRSLQSNILRIFDPLGLLAPILLQSKLLMRESWCSPKPLGWDDVLPEDQGDSWTTFLTSLLNLGELRFPRSLWPQEEVVGLPTLVIFSDGALLAFGAVAYVRWKLKSGGFWSRIVMAKCKIAPKNIMSVPRMELAGAVLNNRLKNFLLKETNMEFQTVYQLVDSSTVLGYLHKHSGVYKVWEGIRVSEIQSTNEFEDGRLKTFAWVGSKDNPADWCTKPRPVTDLEPGGFWQSGPQFLLLEESEWPIKLTYRTDKLEGEIVVGKSLHVSVVNVAHPDLLGRIAHRCGTWKKMKRVLAWILRLGSPSGPLLASEIRRAKHLLLSYAQKDIQSELRQAADTGKGRFRRLAPSRDDSGLWRVGSRIRQYVPFTFDSKLPVILPTKHVITLKIMKSSHNHSHVATDGTLCRFRIEGYWAVKAGVIAKKVANACIDCRKKAKKTISQPLGEIPAEQLQEPMAWGHCQMDLFGPYHCRSDVNTRSTKKIWGVVVEDVNSGAVHLDVVSDYSANSVLLSLRRFGSLRGWPCQMRSDPGSQLVSASDKLENWWSTFGESLQSLGSSKNFEWILSPPDSPWRQGKAERRIAVIKDMLRISVGDTKVTPLELQTIFMEVANLCNERPIGISKPRADGSYSVLTPNHLLLGRSSNILPDDSKVSENLHYSSRYRLVHHVTSVFWRKWCTEVAPRMIFRQKWHEKGRNLRDNDVVMICDASPIKGKYKLAVVETVHASADGAVRSATVRYVNVNGDRVTTVRVQRCVQRLILILPVEEQDDSMEVKDFNSHIQVECCSPVKAGV